MDVDSKSIPELTTARTARSPIAWLSVWLFVAAGCFWFGLQDTDKSTQTPPNGVAAVAQPQYETKAIQDIREGDVVMARDEFGNDLGMKLVVEVYKRMSGHLRILSFRGPDGARQTLKTTNDHPFWIESRNTFVDAGDLQVGDTVEGPHGELQTVAVTLYEPHPEGIPVYNFQVEDYHTYFVQENGARAPPVLVHNANYVPKKIPNPFGKRGSPAHQSRILQAEQRLNGKGWKTVSGGSLAEVKHGNRFPDLVLQKGDRQIAIQVGRATKKSRIPVSRERAAIGDLRGLGDFDHVFFLEY